MNALIVTLLVGFYSILPADAQIITRPRRRRSPGRIIAGAVVAAVCLLIFLIILFVLLSRRRKRARAIGNNQFVGQPTHSNKPFFGGPFGGGFLGSRPAATAQPHGYGAQAPPDGTHWQGPPNPAATAAAPPPYNNNDQPKQDQYTGPSFPQPVHRQ